MVSFLPQINVSLNALTACLLIAGLAAIKGGHRRRHAAIMATALVTSAAFLSCYLIYHYHVGSKPYPYDDWTRILYFSILIPHIILAVAMLPFIFIVVKHAYRGDFARHKRLARIVWPVWMFVSVTGVIVYAMLYRPL